MLQRGNVIKPISGMKQFHDIQNDYDIIPVRDEKLKVKDRYGNNVATAKGIFKPYSDRLHAIMPVSQAETALMEDGTFTAAYMSSYIQGHAHGLNAPKLSSSAVIVIPWGRFWTSRELPIPIGAVTGAGTSWDGTSMASTELSPWHENWRGDTLFRSVMVSQVRGNTGNQRYLESCYIDAIRFNGRAGEYYDPSYESYGIMMAGAGEVNVVGTAKGIRTDHFNNAGFAWAGATPGKIGTITAFKNNRAAVEILGGALATMSVYDISCDDNAYIFRCTRGVVDPGDEGAMLKVGTVKLEGGTNTESVLGGKHKGQMLLELLGQGGVIIDMVQVATTYYVVHSLIKVHPSIAAYGPQNMSVKIGMIKQNRNGRRAFERSFIDTLNDKSWDIPGIYDCETDLKYDSDNGGRVTLDGVEMTSAPYTPNDRLGHIAHDDPRQFDTVLGNPRFFFTGPPVWGSTSPPQPTCIWILGTPMIGPCAGNSQSVTTPYISSVAGCTPTAPKPADVITSQTCGTPPSGTVIDTLNGIGISNVSQSIPLLPVWTNSRVIEFTGFKAGSVLGGTICVGLDRSLKVHANGSVYISITGVGNVQCTPPIPPGTVKANTAVNFNAVLPMPVTFTRLGAIQTTGGAQIFTSTKIIVKNA